jgi:hypothetical protein
MSMEPLPSTSNEPIRLAKLATIFAVIFGIAFGLCTTSAVTGGVGLQGVGLQKVLPFLIGTFLVIEAVCLLGLLVVGVWAIVRFLSNKSQN